MCLKWTRRLELFRPCRFGVSRECIVIVCILSLCLRSSDIRDRLILLYFRTANLKMMFWTSEKIEKTDRAVQTDSPSLKARGLQGDCRMFIPDPASVAESGIKLSCIIVVDHQPSMSMSHYHSLSTFRHSLITLTIKA